MIRATCRCGASGDFDFDLLDPFIQEHQGHGGGSIERPTDQPHPPTQAEREEFWASEPIHIHPEGTQE